MPCQTASTFIAVNRLSGVSLKAKIVLQVGRGRKGPVGLLSKGAHLVLERAMLEQEGVAASSCYLLRPHSDTH